MNRHTTADNSGDSKEALFCIGSNSGERIGNVASALVWLSSILSDFRHTGIYATPDNLGGQREYLNAVCCGLTEYSPAELEAMCKKYEIENGRDETARIAGDVPVDIDLVAYDGEILRKKDYTSEFFLIGYRQLAEAQ